jgi:vancomycin resistance protein YoaR
MRDAAPGVTESALKQSEAHALLLTGTPVILRLGERAWSLEAADLREMLTISPAKDGTYDAALADSDLSEYLQSVATDVRVEPRNAEVVIGKGTVTLNPDEYGSELDLPQAVSLIKQAAEGSDEAARTIDLPMKAIPAEVHTADVQAVYEAANSLVTEGMRLRFRDDGYILRGASVTGFIDVARTQGGPGFKLVVDEDVLATRIRGVAYNINRPANDARFRMVGGAPTKVADAKEGFKVDVARSLENAVAAIASYKGGDRLQVDLDVAVTAPTMTGADLTTINTPDLLGTGQTSYAGSSAERAWNVGLGTRNVDGALIPPGATFSTVEAIGDLTLAAGFKMGYAIINTGNGVTTVPAEAGGICQVATTLFHSVFWSGLEIVERNWHSYWIGTYGRPPSGVMGLDATIAPPEKDFRFRNNTGNWILVKATADGTNVTFQLYGVNPGWKVSMSGPVITNYVKTTQAPVTEYSKALPAGKKVMVEHAQDGFHASITRVVRDAGGNVIDNWTGKSRYVPARNRYLIGTGQ